LQKEMMAYPHDFKTAVVELACDKLGSQAAGRKQGPPSQAWGDWPEWEWACFIVRGA
jgi:hypothetical protein